MYLVLFSFQNHAVSAVSRKFFASSWTWKPISLYVLDINDLRQTQKEKTQIHPQGRLSGVRRRCQRPCALRGHRLLFVSGLFPAGSDQSNPFLLRPRSKLRHYKGYQKTLSILPISKMPRHWHETRLGYDGRWQTGEKRSVGTEEDLEWNRNG